MKKRIFAAALCICQLFTAGCSGGEVDYGIDTETGSEEVGETGEAGSGLSQFEGQETWEDSFTVETGGQKTQVNIVADISLPDVESMSVVEVEEPKVDAAYRKKIVRAIFGDGAVYYYDDAHLPEADLRERVEDYEERLAKAKEDLPDDDSLESNYTVGKRREAEALEDKIDFCERNRKNAPKDYVPAEDYEVDEYLGYRDGIAYVLTFSEESVEVRSEQVSLTPKDLYEVCPEEVRDAEGLELSEWEGDNECEMTEQQALETAEAFLSELGAEGMVSYDTWGLEWAGDRVELSDGWKYNTTRMDGYAFHFQFGIDENPVVGYGVQDDYAVFMNLREEAGWSAADAPYSMSARATVNVTDLGVIGFTVENPLGVSNVTRDVALLPLESIRGILVEELKENLGDYGTDGKNVLRYSYLELIYFRVPDQKKEGSYSYVPYWRLSTGDTNGPELWYSVLVNAIDGSVYHWSLE